MTQNSAQGEAGNGYELQIEHIYGGIDGGTMRRLDIDERRCGVLAYTLLDVSPVAP